MHWQGHELPVKPRAVAAYPIAGGEAAYRAFQWGKNLFGFAHKALSTQAAELMLSALRELQSFVSGKPLPPREQVKVSAATLQELRARYERLLEVDWQDAEAGYYPHALLFDNPWLDFARYYPAVWLELPQIARRVHGRRYQEFSPDISTEGYPKYYLQNFHYQTNGYLSDRSAELYDLQVELLFGGTADAMRRRVIRLLKDALDPNLSAPHILDVACGTGRMLRLCGDPAQGGAVWLGSFSCLSAQGQPAVAGVARELPQLIRANAEAMPYADAFFDAVVSVFLSTSCLAQFGKMSSTRSVGW